MIILFLAINNIFIEQIKILKRDWVNMYTSPS